MGLFSTALLAVVVLIATGVGRLVLRATGAADVSASEKTLVGCTLGLGILSYGVFLIGMAGVLHRWVVTLFLGVLFVLGHTEMKDTLASLTANRNLIRDRPLWVAATLSFVGLAFWVSWTPPHQYDSLVYHLALPEHYILHRRIVPLERVLYSYFPQNGEMLYTLALLLGSDIFAQLFTWLASFLTLLWVFEMAKREVPLTVTLLACLLLASHTSVLLLAPTTYVDPLVMLWVTAACLSFFRWVELSTGASQQRGWLILSGIFAGCALGTKYYAGIACVVLGLFLLARLTWAVRAGEGRSSALDLAFFGLSAAAPFLPWMIRNYVEVGNPVFPFLYRWFDSGRVGWTPESAAMYFQVFTEYGHKGRFLKDLLSFPYLATVQPLRYGGGMDVLGDFGWEALWAAAPLAVWAALKNRYLAMALLYCLGHWGLWFTTGAVLRFLLAIAPLLSLLAAHGLWSLWNVLGKGFRAALAAGLGLALACRLCLFLYVHAYFGSAHVLLGLETREEYLGRRLSYYPCARHIRGRLPPEAKVVVVGEQRSYYIGRDRLPTTVHAPNLYVEWANRAVSPEGLRRELRSQGITHLLLVPGEAQRLGRDSGAGAFAFTPEALKLWDQVETSGRPVFESRGCSVYAL